MKPIITAAMLRKRRPAATGEAAAVPEAKGEGAKVDASRPRVEPTNDHPAFRAPQFGIKHSTPEEQGQ